MKMKSIKLELDQEIDCPMDAKAADFIGSTKADVSCIKIAMHRATESQTNEEIWNKF